MKLFNVGKVGLFLDDYKATTEKRASRGEVKVLCMTLRAQPMHHQLATAIDPLVRSALFKLGGNGDPLVHMKAAEFHFPFDRQNITVYTTPDTTEPTILFDQVRVMSVRARTEKGCDGYALVVKAQFEHSDAQLAFIDHYKGKQFFVTTEEAEPMLDDVVGDEDVEDDDDQPALAMEGEGKDKDEDGELVGAGAERQQHKPHSHQKKNGKKR